MNHDFFNFLNEIKEGTDQGHYKWQARSYDRVAYSNSNFTIVIDKLFDEETGHYLYYVSYEAENNRFTIPVSYYGDEENYQIVSHLFDSASVSSFVRPKFKM
ncbi:hypothetical protein [Neisseria elongata]|mgnify:CR=1 FL=1|jgi:hypothetical protein|uniref:hypothetical protein n=1 Tax=Neisseria elongata TaxID=495 RepID=UPI000D37B6D4|nr:hypothetical protein [Neisseria elongata]